MIRLISLIEFELNLTNLLIILITMLIRFVALIMMTSMIKEILMEWLLNKKIHYNVPSNQLFWSNAFYQSTIKQKCVKLLLENLIKKVLNLIHKKHLILIPLKERIMKSNIKDNKFNKIRLDWIKNPQYMHQGIL
jgi:hypothetical protein